MIEIKNNQADITTAFNQNARALAFLDLFSYDIIQTNARAFVFNAFTFINPKTGDKVEINDSNRTVQLGTTFPIFLGFNLETAQFVQNTAEEESDDVVPLYKLNKNEDGELLTTDLRYIGKLIKTNATANVPQDLTEKLTKIEEDIEKIKKSEASPNNKKDDEGDDGILISKADIFPEIRNFKDTYQPITELPQEVQDEYSRDFVSLLIDKEKTEDGTDSYGYYKKGASVKFSTIVNKIVRTSTDSTSIAYFYNGYTRYIGYDFANSISQTENEQPTTCRFCYLAKIQKNDDGAFSYENLNLNSPENVKFKQLLIDIYNNQNNGRPLDVDLKRVQTVDSYYIYLKPVKLFNVFNNKEKNITRQNSQTGYLASGELYYFYNITNNEIGTSSLPVENKDKTATFLKITRNNDGSLSIEYLYDQFIKQLEKTTDKLNNLEKENKKREVLTVDAMQLVSNESNYIQINNIPVGRNNFEITKQKTKTAKTGKIYAPYNTTYFYYNIFDNSVWADLNKVEEKHKYRNWLIYEFEKTDNMLPVIKDKRGNKTENSKFFKFLERMQKEKEKTMKDVKLFDIDIISTVFIQSGYIYFKQSQIYQQRIDSFVLTPEYLYTTDRGDSIYIYYDKDNNRYQAETEKTEDTNSVVCLYKVKHDPNNGSPFEVLEDYRKIGNEVKQNDE